MQRKRNRKRWAWALLALLALIAIGVGLGVGLGLGLNKDKDKNKSSSDASAGDSNAGKSASESAKEEPTKTSEQAKPSATSEAPKPKPTMGGQGSNITLSDGTTMVYDNPHGGYWVQDPENPFNNDARPNSWTQPLNETWDMNSGRIWGVNLGGWLNTEPFIVPGLYEDYLGSGDSKSKDEYWLSTNMGANLTEAMTEHYETFITERDFAEIASAGLNWIRLPIGHWAVSKWDNNDEPFLANVAWNYVLKAIQWARKYGLRIQLDLHTVPGSQNGWNHSGRLGPVGWMNGAMGLANAQRALDIIRSLAQFISQPEYAPVVQMFGFINEPIGSVVGKESIAAFYAEAYREIRAITGTGSGKGPILSAHDAFLGLPEWHNFMPGADRFAMDQHPYLVFQPQMKGDLASMQYTPCNWARDTNDTLNKVGLVTAGEWSAAINDCGQWVNGVDLGTRYDGTYAGFENDKTGDCAHWNDYTTWSDEEKKLLRSYVMSSMDALQHWFFWTWKIGPTKSNPAPNPFWNYQLGLKNGWIPSDPHEAMGNCANLGGVDYSTSTTGFQPWMTGGAGAGEIANQVAFPPAKLSNVPENKMSDLAQYTQTADPVTLAGISVTKPSSTETFAAGDGWFNKQQNRKAYTKVANCVYPGPYESDKQEPGNNMCGAGAVSAPARRNAPAPGPTPAAKY